MNELEPVKIYEFGKKNYLLDYFESSGARLVTAAGPIPSHIAFCMDGNRRFAKKEKLNVGAGHVAGFETMLRLLLACYRIGVKTVTVYAFSIENFNRSREESDILFELVRTKLWRMVKNRDSAMRRLGWHIRFPGNRGMLAEDIIERINAIENCTANCKEMVVNICAPYTTRDDLAHALSVAATLAPGNNQSHGSYATLLSQSRYMAPSEPLDIFVRTSGETRFSDFMCWEAASHCTFEFVPQLWPELTVWHLYKIIAKWQVRTLVNKKSRYPQPFNTLGFAPPLVSVSQKGKPKTKTSSPTNPVLKDKDTRAVGSLADSPINTQLNNHGENRGGQVSSELELERDDARRNLSYQYCTDKDPQVPVKHSCVNSTKLHNPETVASQLQMASIAGEEEHEGHKCLGFMGNTKAYHDVPIQSDVSAPPLITSNETRVSEMHFVAVGMGTSQEDGGGDEESRINMNEIEADRRQGDMCTDAAKAQNKSLTNGIDKKVGGNEENVDKYTPTASDLDDYGACKHERNAFKASEDTTHANNASV